ncbi:MAG: chemotaxis protein CheA [Sulfuricellaceae bacterium]|nr:chemotaxis protein CheA [Sulfuricellaceae bacterium]
MTIDMSQFYQVFFDETAEHLAQMEGMLVALDISAPNLDDLNAIFRAAHSIKGGSGTFGFTDMTEVTHILENLLDRLRKEELALRDEMVDAFLSASDVLKLQLDAHQNGGDVDPELIENVCARLKQLAQGEASESVQQAIAETGESPSPAREDQVTQVTGTRYEILYTPDPETAAHPDRLENLYEELRRTGSLEILDGEAATKKLHLSTQLGLDEIRETFEFIAEVDQFSITAMHGSSDEVQAYGFFDTDEPKEESYGFFGAEPAPEANADYGFFTELPTAIPASTEVDDSYGFFAPIEQIQPDNQAKAEENQGYGFFHETAPLPEKPAPSPAIAAKPAPAAVKQASTTKPSAAADTSIRVSVDKVDQLINLVGELVITQSMLAQTASQLDSAIHEKLMDGMAQLERNTRDMQESVMSIRMMPISSVFSRFPRVVRDLANKLNKQVELKTLGEGTELDKGLIEKLADPMTHLVRNSLDHGIELPDVRIAAGKPAKGTITLRAEHQGGNIVIEVSDDGAGLNRDRILGKAKEKGIPVPDNMPDSEVWLLIFAPGFSTAEVVTDVSGRGVGMDVVKRNIHEMGGRIEIDSTLGLGTRMIIRLPLTLAILDGLSISVGDEIYILPLSFIVESLQPSPDDIKTVSGQGRVIHVRGEYLPLVALHELFGIEPRVKQPQDGILVLVEADGKKMALFVDELIGQHQVVIKSLESNYRKVKGVSGATIMGDGKVALILDVSALAREFRG